MIVDSKKSVNKRAMYKKSAANKKVRSVPSLIAKNRITLQKLKNKENENDFSDEASEMSSNDSDENIKIETFKDRNGVDGTSSIESESELGENIDDFGDRQHKKSLANLKVTDPEFYKFLEDNDKKLLNFELLDNESSLESDNEDEVHKPSDQLEVYSDEDDFVGGESWKGSTGQLITLAMVSEWRTQLQNQPSVQIISEVVRAFQAAIITVSGKEEAEQNRFRVDGSSVFNAVVQLCVLELHPALVKVLNIHTYSVTIQPTKCKRWSKVKNFIKAYLNDLLKLLGGVSSANILSVLLKHLHQMIVFLGYHHSLTKTALKQLVALWSLATEEAVRVIAFLCILRLTTNQQRSLLDSVLKMMYVAFISNSKFMSVSMLHNVTFMRRSLAEIFCLDMTISYQHAFLYIRQLAIQLRNAVTVHKKESIQAVCNWQYMNSVRLWVDLICSTNDQSPLRPLLYPLVQVIVGCIRLLSTAQYIPIRFHCCQLLTKLSQETGIYIPVLPFIIEALTLIHFKKSNKKLSMKPMDFTCVLRVSKAGLSENGFRDATVDQVYQLLLEYCANESHLVSFPDIILPSLVQLRSIIKECNVGKFSQKLRQLVVKIEESAQWLENERKTVALQLTDKKAVNAWEMNIKIRGTPLAIFYQSWQKVHQRQAAKQATNNDKLGNFDLPQVKRSPAPKKFAAPEQVELFPSDSESDIVNFGGEEIRPKKRSIKQIKKNVTSKSNLVKKQKTEEESDSSSISDIVEELRLSDLE